MTRSRNREKRDIALQWIASGIIRTEFRPALCEQIPAWLRRDQKCVLEWGYDMPRPIRDLKIDSEGISGTLAFRMGAVIFECVIPWEAVYLISSRPIGQIALWEEDMPASAQRDVEVAERRSSFSFVKGGLA